MAINLTSFVSELAQTLTASGFEATASGQSLSISGHVMQFHLRGRRRREVYIGYRYVARWGPTLAAAAIQMVLWEMTQYAQRERQRIHSDRARQLHSALRPLAERCNVSTAVGSISIKDPIQLLGVLVALGAMTGPGDRHEREAFILGLLDGTCNPLIFADWLEENDDDIAGVIRAFCALLPEAT